MLIKCVLPMMHNGLRRFRADQAGNVAVTFTLALVPIMGFVGTAVDYSRGNSIKSAMQQAADSTALPDHVQQVAGLARMIIRQG